MVAMRKARDLGRGRDGWRLLVLVAGVVGLAALTLPASGIPAPAAPPQNTAEPTISGRAEQGQVLEASRGSWTGSGPIAYAFRWLRCGSDGGAPDGSNCPPIGGATSSRYRVRAGDVGFRLRVRVTASNSDGSRSATSNPTAVVAGGPVPTGTPTVRGTTLVGSVVTADPGTWTGAQPIVFAFRWIRCNSQGGACVSIAGATSRSYRLTSADLGHRMRFHVTARNSVGSRTVTSGESPIVSEPLPAGGVRLPSGEVSIPAASVPSNHRLVVSEVRFSPRTVTSRRQAIVAAIRLKDTRGYVIRDAFIFIRSTPRVTTGGDRRLSGMDGWLSYELLPLSTFPTRAKTAVQFFVKAYRSGDPSLGGVYGSRLVQVPVRLR